MATPTCVLFPAPPIIYHHVTCTKTVFFLSPLTSQGSSLIIHSTFGGGERSCTFRCLCYFTMAPKSKHFKKPLGHRKDRGLFKAKRANRHHCFLHHTRKQNWVAMMMSQQQVSDLDTHRLAVMPESKSRILVC